MVAASDVIPLLRAPDERQQIEILKGFPDGGRLRWHVNAVACVMLRLNTLLF